MAKILVIDDSVDIHDLMRKTFADEHIVICHPNAIDAEEELEKWKFDLVICDVNMPYKSGLIFIEQIRATHRHKTIPIIVISADSSAHRVKRAINAGVDGFYVKPLDLKDLSKKARELLRYAKPKEVTLSTNDNEANGIAIETHQMRVFSINEVGVCVLSKSSLPVGKEISFSAPVVTKFGVSCDRYEVISCSAEVDGAFKIILKYKNIIKEELFDLGIALSNVN